MGKKILIKIKTEYHFIWRSIYLRLHQVFISVTKYISQTPNTLIPGWLVWSLLTHVQLRQPRGVLDSQMNKGGLISVHSSVFRDIKWRLRINCTPRQLWLVKYGLEYTCIRNHAIECLLRNQYWVLNIEYNRRQKKVINLSSPTFVWVSCTIFMNWISYDIQQRLLE